jgi:hypothetical protein
MEMETDFYFIKNAGQSGTIGVIYLFVYCIEKIFASINISKFSLFFKEKVTNEWEFNSFLDLLWNVYMYVLFSVILQFYCFEINDFVSYFNYAFFGIFAAISILAPFVILIYIY